MNNYVEYLNQLNKEFIQYQSDKTEFHILIY